MMSLVEQLAASVGVTLPVEPMPSPLDTVHDGAVFVVERKTSGEDITPGAQFWQRKTLDVQPTMYLAAEPRAEFVLYDVLRKPEAHRLEIEKAKSKGSRRGTQAPIELTAAGLARAALAADEEKKP